MLQAFPFDSKYQPLRTICFASCALLQEEGGPSGLPTRLPGGPLLLGSLESSGRCALPFLSVPSTLRGAGDAEGGRVHSAQGSLGTLHLLCLVPDPQGT